MLGSGLMSGLMTLWSQRARRQSKLPFDRAITGLAAQSEATDLARNTKTQRFQVTRRIIALSAVFAVIVWP